MSEIDSLPKSRTAYVLERLKADLLSGEISPGEQLRQNPIAKRYGVSPTPVREALRILAADGTIEYITHRGATVRDFTPEMAADLYQLRATMEGFACEIAVARMTDEDYERVLEANQRLLRARIEGAVPDVLSILNKELHFAIYHSTSKVITECIEMLWARFKPSITLWRISEFSAALDDDHSEILDALARRDASAAGIAMRDHILHAWALRQTSDDLRARGMPESE